MAKGAGTVIYLGTVLKVLAVLAYLLAMVDGIVGLVYVGETGTVVKTCSQYSGNPSCVSNLNYEFAVAIIAALNILFAFVGLLGELELGFVLTHVQLLASYWGKAIYLGVMGVMTLGVAGDLGIASCIVCLFVAAALFISALFCARPASSAADDSKV